MSLAVRLPFARQRYFVQRHGLAVSLRLAAGFFHLAMRARGVGAPDPASIRALRERFRALLERDWDQAERGYYPREMLFEFPLGEYLRLLPRALADTPKVIRRRHRGRYEELPEGIDASEYPSYYLRNFHWQTDGWLSDRSAELYDFGVDVVFGAATDALRRMSIPPLADAVAGVSRPRILDVAGGTGRFLGVLARALPQAQLYGVDLSPFYAARARERVPEAGILVENAERLPFADGWFDAVSCVFLLHELPRDTRRDVVREIRRVLKPGGTLVLNDSAQLADSEEMSFFLDAFQRTYHEPYFKSYLRDPMESVAADAGLAVVSAEPHFVAKVVVATR